MPLRQRYLSTAKISEFAASVIMLLVSILYQYSKILRINLLLCAEVYSPNYIDVGSARVICDCCLLFIIIIITCIIITKAMIYTPCPEKKSLEYFRHNFIKYWPIFEILLLLQSAGNLQ